MKPTKLGLLFHKSKTFLIKVRIFILKLRGLQVKESFLIGRISIDWPNCLYIGNGCEIQDDVDFRIYRPFTEDSFIKIGDRVFIGHSCDFVSSLRITIGDDCLIASKCTFNDTGHEHDRALKVNEQPVTQGEIIIHDDVWIGTNSVILRGVTIGKGAVIGAGSVVNKSIPEYQVWAGVPARFIRNRE